jgi:hypothetical protein
LLFQCKNSCCICQVFKTLHDEIEIYVILLRVERLLLVLLESMTDSKSGDTKIYKFKKSLSIFYENKCLLKDYALLSISYLMRILMNFRTVGPENTAQRKPYWPHPAFIMIPCLNPHHTSLNYFAVIIAPELKFESAPESALNTFPIARTKGQQQSRRGRHCGSSILRALSELNNTSKRLRISA